MGDLVSISSTFLYVAFFIYLIATVLFAATIRDKKNTSNNNFVSKLAVGTTIVGFVSQLLYFILRWIAAGHAPVSNLFEFVTFFGMMLVLAFLLLFFIYRLNLLGLFTLPIALLLIAYASVFPREVTPLVPSLKSHWLYIHVTTVSLGEAILAVSFIAGLIYLIRQVDQSISSKSTKWLEIVIYSLFATIGFVLVSSVYAGMGYSSTFEFPYKGDTRTVEYEMPPLIGPDEGVMLDQEKMSPLVESPSFLQGVDAAKKLNTLVWSMLLGFLLYLIVRLILRKRIAASIQPLLKRANPELVDEICYRAVAIGFPVFTLGGLIFASIWAQEAWDRYWGWDPKEVWALITWFFYAVFLHLRLSRGWHGEKSAWLAVIGFAIIMFNLIVVNLVIAGLHSYA